jgi:hypothetical protein
MTAGNIGNVSSSAGICVLVQQTDLKKLTKQQQNLLVLLV